MDFEARRIIEALRSGVSSRVVGQYFSSARQDTLSMLSRKLNEVCENGTSSGLVVTGKYGEGKTHLLNTVFGMAQSENMVVSLVSLGKETPFDKLYLVYQKLLQNTYLPKRLQPGIGPVLTNITPHSPLAEEMSAYAAMHLPVNKLFYLFRAYLHTDDMDEKFWLLADLAGDLISNAALKKIYRRIFNEKVTYNANFSKTKHMGVYFAFLSHLFKQLGYGGWVILLDETELTGRLGKKARLNAYKNMASFLFPEAYSQMQSTFSLFTLTDSYLEEVVERKHEYDNLSESLMEPQDKEAAGKALAAITSAVQLKPLNKEEILLIMEKLTDFYQRAYDWYPTLNLQELFSGTDNRGYLLRTRIRAILECLDQLYQYQQAGDLRIDALGQMSYEEDIPELPLDLQ